MTLRVLEKPCWEAVCDFCGEGDNYDYATSFHHASEAEARAELAAEDWKLAPDGRALCFGCFDSLRARIPCPHGSHCNGGGCGFCPTDEQVFEQLEENA
jgi:hypothetical protein